MKLHIKWKFPDEEKVHDRTFYDIDPKSICISNGFLFFNMKDHGTDLRYKIDYIIRMEMEEE